MTMDYFHKDWFLSSKKLQLPFRSFEKCAKVIPTFGLMYSIVGGFKLLDRGIEEKAKHPWYQLWTHNRNELKIYIWALQKELRSRGIKDDFYPELSWSGFNPPYWYYDDLFYISQKVNMLRNGFKYFVRQFYVSTWREWPEGCYYPVNYKTPRQRKINREWITCFRDRFDNDVKKVRILVNKKQKLIEGDVHKKLFTLEDLIEMKRKKRNVSKRKKTLR